MMPENPVGFWDTLPEGPQYDIAEMVIFRNFRDGTFGDLIQVPSVNLVTVRFNYKTKSTQGNARITYTNSQIESAQVTFRNFSISQAILEILLDVDSYTYGTTPNRIRRMTVGANRMKYFGIAAKCFAGDDGDTHIMLPYMILDSSFDWSFQYNDFVQPQMQATAIADPVLRDARGRPMVVDALEHETETDLAVPFEWPTP